MLIYPSNVVVHTLKKLQVGIIYNTSDRFQRVSVNGSLSDQFPLKQSVPQGSCLGPLLFTIYTRKLFQIVERHLPQVHCYADDTQLYVSFCPNRSADADFAIKSMTVCPVTVARNLGSWFDEQLTTCMSTHISKLCGVAFYRLRNIKRIRKYLSRESTEMLVHAFITPRVDYCNSLVWAAQLPA